MSYWTWDSTLSVGIDVIDEQHKRFVDYINELDVARLEKNRDKVSQVLMGLADYTVTHFAFEEDLMSQSGYPLSESHKRVHESFIGYINKYKEQHESGQDITRKLMSDLQIWLTNHIKYQDQDYAPYAAKVVYKEKSWLKKSVGRLFD